MESPANTWKSANTPLAQRRHRRLTLLVGAGVALGLVVCVMVWMLQPPPQLRIICMGNDRRSSAFPSAEDWRNISRDELRLRLSNWNTKANSNPTLVYLSGSVHADETGTLLLGAVDDNADHSRNPLSLGDLLDRLPATHSGLVVLDLTSAEIDWVPLARKTLEGRPEFQWSVLFARSRGEADAPGLDSVLNTGMSGMADGWNASVERDHRVSFAELAAYARHRQQADEPPLGQGKTTPWWIERSSSTRFALAAGTRDEAKPVDERTYPQELRAAWPQLEDSAARAKFLTVEKCWLNGEPVQAVLNEFNKPAAIDNGLSLAAKSWAKRLQRPKPGDPAPALPEDVLLALLKQPETWTQTMLLELATASKATITEPSSAATLQLWRAAGSPSDTMWPLLLRNLRATLEWEEFVKSPVDVKTLREVTSHWHTAWATLFANGYCQTNSAEKAITTLEDSLRSLQQIQAEQREIVKQLRRMDALALLVKPSTEFITQYQLLQQNQRNALAPAQWILQQDTASWNTEQRLPALQRVRAGSSTTRDWVLLRQWLDTGMGTFEERAEVWNLWLAGDAHRLRKQVSRVQEVATIVWIDPRTEQPAEVATHQPWRGQVELTGANRQAWLNWQVTCGMWSETNPWGFRDAEAEIQWANRQRKKWQADGGHIQAMVEAELRPEPATWPANSRSIYLSSTVRLVENSDSAIHAETPLASDVSVSPSELKLPTSIRQSTLKWEAKLNTPVEQGVSLRGAFLQLSSPNGPVFARLPIDTRELTRPLRLLVTQGTDKPLSLDQLLLRPNGQPAVHIFAIASRSTEARRVIVECPALQLTSGEIVLAPQASTMLVFRRGPATVPFVEPVRMSSLDLVVRDAETKNISQTLSLPLAAADPRSLVAVKSASLQPISTGSEVSIQLQRNSALVSPVPVKLEFPADRNAGLAIRNGLLGSLIQPTDNLLSLSASLNWSGGKPKTFEAHLSMDGVARTVVFRGDATNINRNIPLAPVTTPSLRIVTPVAHDGNHPLTVRVECDAEPPGAMVRCSLGTGRNEEFRSDFESKWVDGKTTDVFVKWHESGGLSLMATRKDSIVVIPVGRLAGKRWLRGELCDSKGTVLATEWVPLIFDAEPPKGLKFVDIPEKAKRGQPLKVTLEVEPPPGGLKDIRLFTGASTNTSGEPESSATVFQAKPVDASQRQWIVTVPIEDRPGPVLIHAKARSNSGQTTTIQHTLERVDATELDTAKPGEVTGLVLEGDIAQAGMDVKLTDAKKKSLTATTDEKGRYRFTDVLPGNYTLSAVKSSTNRGASLPVVVKADSVAKADLSLLLQSP